MNTAPRYNKEDLIVNFRDMFLHVLLRWRTILVGVLIVTLLAGGGKYLADRQAQKSAAAEQEVTLDAASLANAQMVISYQRAYYSLAEYNERALLMQIDAGKVPTQVLSYLVSGPHSYTTATLYRNAISDASVYQVLTAAGETVDPAYLQELVTAVVETGSTGTVDIPDEPVVLTVKIIAPDEALCRQLADGLTAHLAAVVPQVTAAAGNHTITLVGNTFSFAGDTLLKTNQQTNINNANALRTNLRVALDGLTDDEALYVRQHDPLSDEETAVSAPAVSKKFLALGFAGGLVLFVGLAILGYLLDKHVKSGEDLQQRYGLYLLGALERQDGSRKGSTRRILRRFRPATDSAMLEQQAVLAAQSLDDNKPVFITGCALTDKDKHQLQSLSDALTNAGIPAVLGNCPLHDAQAVRQLAAAGGVILAEKAGVSAYDDIGRELELCRRHDRPLLGAILLQ